MERQKAAQAAQTGQFGSLQKFSVVICGQGTVLNGNLCVVDQNTLNAAFLSTMNLFDNIPNFPKIEPVQIGVFFILFIISIFVGRQFSRKKRIERRVC